MKITKDYLTKRLNEEPKFTKVNKQAKKRKDENGNYHDILYIPVSHLQNTLDELFGAMGWSFELEPITIVVNEMVGRGKLTVIDPISGRTIVRYGAAAVMIRQHSGTENTDINAKIKNGLQMDVPHLLSECLKSAVKTLGKTFGRDLNREFFDNYDESESIEVVLDIQSAIQQATTVEQLKDIRDSYPNKVKDPIVYTAFMKRWAELNPAPLQIEAPKNEAVEIAETEAITIKNTTNDKTA